MAKKKIKPPEKVDDVPATRGMLHLVRDDLRSEIRSVDYKWECRFKGLDIKFLNIDSRFDKIDQRFEQVDRRFERIDARFEEIDRRFEQIDARFEQINQRFEKVDARFEQIDRRFEQVDARFEQIDRRFEQVDARFEQIDRRFEQVDARFEELEAKMDLRFDQARAENLSLFNQIMSKIHQTHSLIEEQEARNRVVMEGLNVLFERQERCERKVDEFEKTLATWNQLK